MVDFTQLLAGTAFAQTTAGASTPSGMPSIFGPQMIVFALIIAVFYFLLIRPQQKKLDEQERMIKALKRGDRIVTAGGIHGKIVKLEGDDALYVEIADGVQIKLSRASVQSLAAKTEPAATSNEPGEDKKD